MRDGRSGSASQGDRHRLVPAHRRGVDPLDPGFVDQLPYVVALVALEEDPAIRLLTNLVEIEPDAIDVDMAVEVVFEPLGDTALPQFRPVTARGGH